MNITLGIFCGTLTLLLCGGFIYFRRKRIERCKDSNFDIPNFLRSGDFENKNIGSIQTDSIANICRIRKTK